MTQRLLHCVGLSDEDLAHIRLLLRLTRGDLRDTWTWGSEARADLVVVNPRRLLGDSARRRAIQRGVACVQVLEANDANPAGPFLRKPFRRETLVGLMNRVGQEALAPVDDDLDDAFADMDLGVVDLSQLESDYPGKQAAFVAGGQHGESFAAIVPPTSTEAMPDYSVLPSVREAIREAGIGRALADAISRACVAQPAPAEAPPPEPDLEPDPVPPPDIPFIDPDATFTLSEYIGRNLLGGAARIVLPRQQQLILDPQRDIFLANGSLRALEPYVRQPLRYGDWERMGPEVETLRRQIHPRPLALLAWLERFIRSGGFLPRHIDAGGVFRLTKRLELGEDYPRAARVAGYMGQPRKLHEIARLSGVDLDDVFSVVSAYEAIGYVEWSRRDA